MIDYFLNKQLCTGHKMLILLCKRIVRFWVSSAEDYKEPEEAFKKVTGDRIGFEYYFLNKLFLNLF